MGNIKNFNFAKLKLQISNSDYWDFYLANDESSGDCDSLLSGSCFVVWYDFNNSNTFLSGLTNNIHSLVSWSGATNSGYTLNTIGLTGIDNGLITFDKVSGDTTNQALLSALTESVYVIQSGNTGLMMNAVTGTTSGLTYDILVNSGLTEGQYMDFMGGFYQGFYKLDGKTYEVLPTRVNHSWSAEFWLKPKDVNTTGTTINDLYPNNKGFFFYMGTRAENKFWNQFYGADTGCTSGCTISECSSGETVSEWCTIPKETDITIVGDYGIGIPLSPPQMRIDLITNEFLIYGRGSGDVDFSRYTAATGTIEIDNLDGDVVSGCTSSCRCRRCTGPDDGLAYLRANQYDGNGIAVGRTRTYLSNENNPFLIYGRARLSGSCAHSFSRCSGPNDGFGNERANTFSGRTAPLTELDYNVDIIDNALGFRITDDGRIGYRLLTVTGGCQTVNNESVYVSGVTIEEKYSEPNMVAIDDWSYVVVKFVTDFKSDCDLKISSRRKGKLMFYVNAKLKFIVNEFDEFIAKRLDEYKDKQVGVPFNFSLGGGSQGLMESQTFDGLDPRDRNLPIQENFAGTFIGSISQFKYNICELKYCNIVNNYNAGLAQYNPNQPNYLLTEDGEIINSQNNENILWQ
jgi:hypothetical protein